MSEGTKIPTYMWTCTGIRETDSAPTLLMKAHEVESHISALHAEAERLRETVRVLADALTEAICIIGSLDGVDNSCDPKTDISDLQAALSKARPA